MRDEERIQMYYKFGLLDWRNEHQFEKERSSSRFDLFTANFKILLIEIIQALKIKTRI